MCSEIGAAHVEATFKDGCLSLRLAVMEKMRGQLAPGPIYEIRDSFGIQTRSDYRSSPCVGFTKGGQNSHGRPIELPQGRGVPGPKYDLNNITYGRQVNSRMRTSPMPGFGSSERPPLTPEICSPGPNTAYFVTSANQRGPSPSFGGATWRSQKINPDKDTPGPGSYQIPSASGKQVLSTKRTMAINSFGGSNIKRDLAKPRAHEEPGPGSYNPQNCPRRIRSVPFGTAGTRQGISFSSDIKPAPDKYMLPSGIGQQVSSRKRSTPAYSFGAR